MLPIIMLGPELYREFIEEIFSNKLEPDSVLAGIRLCLVGKLSGTFY